MLRSTSPTTILISLRSRLFAAWLGLLGAAILVDITFRSVLKLYDPEVAGLGEGFAFLPGPLNAIPRIVLIPILFGVLIAGSTLWLIVGPLVKALRELRNALVDYARGEPVELDVSRADEIGDINRAFMVMRNAIEQSRAAERLFLLRISHELRTPLAAIRGQSEALRDDLFRSDGSREIALQAIVDETDRLERLVGDLTDLARLHTGSFTFEEHEVDLHLLATMAIHLVETAAAGNDIEVVPRYGDLPFIVGDGDRLLQVLANLLRNAVRWSPRGGVVQFGIEANGRMLAITVNDEGPGVPLEKRERIFEMLYSESGSGTGVGLAITRDLVRAMGGNVQVGDAPGGGASFIVRLPYTAAQRSQMAV